MRDYLFRGKRKDDCEWLEGFALFADNKAFIFNNVKVEFLNGYNEYRMNFTLKEVIPETVGQYTGLTDKNGKKIFEGDILEGLCGLHKVYFDEGFACFDWKNTSGKQSESFSGFADEYKIVGNIYDNKEILDVK